MKPAANMNAFWAELIIEELSRHSLAGVCLSPGSRSTPFAIAAMRHERIGVYTHFDERGAAFHALGLAKATGSPAVLVCTSGTAVANYLPAVVEAAQSQTPLILLTADRPPELQDNGANQTIDQVKLFGGYVRWQATLPCPDERIDPHYVLTTVDQAVYRACRGPAGPVHIDCMFREPLAPVPDGADVERAAARIEAWRTNHAPLTPYTQYAMPKSVLDSAQQRHVLVTINNAQRGALVVGQLHHPMEAAAVAALAEALQWPVLPDITSGLRIGTPRGPWLHYYDQLLLAKRFRHAFTPDVVVHVGGPVVSKRLQQQFEAHPPKQYIRVADHPFRIDPSHRVTQRIEADVARFCSWLGPNLEPKNESQGWLDLLRRYNETIGAALTDRLQETVELDEAVLARLVSRGMDNDAVLFLGNSMPIRDMDMYGAPEGPRVRVAANRGASGIDGTVATAAGYANGSKKAVVAVIGDLAVLHDLNSLALLRNTAAPVVLVAVNNDGGGIFHFLPVAQAASDVFEPAFATPHGLTFEAAAEMFGLQYHHPVTARRFVETLKTAQKSLRSSIIEVTVTRRANLDAHKALQEAVMAAAELV